MTPARTKRCAAHLRWPTIAFALHGILLGTAGCGAPQRAESQTPFDLGREKAQVKDYATAIAQLTIAVNNAQDYFFTPAYLERGDCYLKLATSTDDPVAREQSLKYALDDFSRVLEQPDLQLEEEARALALEGKTLLVRGDVAGAEKSFSSLIEAELPRSELHYQLEAHGELGWILLDRARAAQKPHRTAEEEIASQDLFRAAQDHFSRGLEIDGENEDCNLGKGICLHLRDQNREALSFLEKCTAQSDLKGTANPRAHFYLALALQYQKGFQEKARQHLRKAVEQDSRQTFTPLYAYLVEVLLVYVPFEDPHFHWFLDNMLSYAGDDRTYWSSVESFASRLASDASPDRRETGIFARALARARSEKIDVAVQDTLLLKSKPNFLELIARVFPTRQPRAEYLYGRALTLLGARRNAELEEFFNEAAYRSPDPAVLESDYYQRTTVLEGKNIMSRWLEARINTQTLSTQDKIDRDRTLGKARDAFQGYLAEHPKDREVGMALGEVQELMEVFPGALLSYAVIAREVTDHTAAFRRIEKLHSEKLLPEKDLTEAWIVLQGYTGPDEEVRSYVRRTQIALQIDSLLYCQNCGRKGAEGDVSCLECGRLIGRPTERPSPATK